MNIMIIAGYYPPEQSADTRLNQDLVEGLASKGHKVKLVVPFPNRGISKRTKTEYLNKKHEIVSEQLEIFRIGSPTNYSQGIVKRGFSFLKKSFEIYRFAKGIDCDICMVVSTPPTLGYVAALLSRKKRVVYKLQDAFPDSLMHSKKMSNRSLIVIILKQLEKWIYRSVHSIITVSDDLKNTLIKRGVPQNKITVIYDWIDDNKCLPISRDKNYLFDKFELNREDFYVSYAGNVGQLQNLKTIVRASEIVAKYRSDIKFVIIGNGSWENTLKQLISKKKYKNICTFPMQPTNEIAYVYSLGDIGIVSLKPGVTKIALPSKTWDIMSAQKAVLCEIDLYSGLCDIVSKNGCGYCVRPNDALDMARKIIKMYDEKQKTIQMGMRGREYIKRHLSISSAINKYSNYFLEEVEK